MGRVHRVVLLLAAAVGMVWGQGAAWAADAEANLPQASLQGAWRAVAMVHSGRQVPENQVRQLILVFSDTKIVMRAGRNVIAETAYTIDAKSKPAAIDMTFQGQATLGIFELTIEKLRICLNDLDKGRPEKFAASPGAACDVDFQLYRADRDWPKLHVLDADGANARLLAPHAEFSEQGSPEWSLDGGKIAFDACRTILGESWSMSHILTCRADGKELKDLGPGAMPSWSPDGKQITYSCYNPRGVWTMNADGTGRQLLDAEGWGAQWCPKGNKIAYTLYGADGANICVRGLAEATSSRLLETSYRQIYWGMAWSPDGRWIAFKGVTPEAAEVAVVSAEGQSKGFRVLVSEGRRGVKHLMDNVSWTPDSKLVLTAFSTQSDPALQIHVVDIDGKTPPKPLPRQQKGRSFHSVACSPDGKQILVSTTAEAR